MSSCNETKCCDRTQDGCCPEGADCCAPADGPIEQAAQCWDGAFMEAMKQAKVEILKGKILAAWGPMLEQGADAKIEAMEACWQSKLAAVRAHEADQGFRGKLRELWDGDAA